MACATGKSPIESHPISGPNDLNSLQAAVEKHFGKCNITYAEQAKAMREAGVVESRREAAREIAKDTGETPAAAECRIRRGEKEVRQRDAQEPTPPTSSESPGNKENKELTQTGKPRQRAEGGGRKPKYQKELMTANLPSVTPLAELPATEKFREAFELFFTEIKNAKASKWQTTPKNTVLRHIKVLYDVTTIQ